MNEFIYNPILEEMKIKEVNRNRTINFLGEFNEDNCYKCEYLIRKIISLDEINNVKKEDLEPIKINISSYGGAIYELFGLLQLLKQCKAKGYKIITECVGKAMSCGFVLFIYGDIRIASTYSSLLYHSASTCAIGKIQDIEDELSEVKRLNEIILDTICDNTNIPREMLENINKEKKDYIFNIEEVKKYNIANKII